MEADAVTDEQFESLLGMAEDMHARNLAGKVTK